MKRAVNTILILTIIILGSCNDDTIYIQCSKNLSDYPSYQYELFGKSFIKVIGNDSAYSANINIKLLQPKGTRINMDSLYQYILAISYNEKLIKARFFRNENGFITANQLELKEYMPNKMRTEISDETQKKEVLKNFIGSLVVKDLSNDWLSNLNSEDIYTGGFKQIAPAKRKIFTLEE